MARTQCTWVASLSNGATKTEQEYLDAKQPAYGSLLQLIKVTAAKLTGFRLQRAGITYNAPSASPHAKFPTTVPFELDHRRRACQNSNGSEESFCNFIVKVGNISIKHWVDEATGDTWMQIEEIKKE